MITVNSLIKQLQKVKNKNRVVILSYNEDYSCLYKIGKEDNQVEINEWLCNEAEIPSNKKVLVLYI